jgi:hypothetical protein
MTAAYLTHGLYNVCTFVKKSLYIMTELLDLCYDVLIRILEEIDPPDLAACAETSVGFNAFLKKNTRLYKAHYLKTFVSHLGSLNPDIHV